MKSNLWFFLLALLSTPLRVAAWWWRRTPLPPPSEPAPEESDPVDPDVEPVVDMALVLVGNTSNPEAICSEGDFTYVQDKLVKGVFDTLFYERRELGQSRQLQSCSSLCAGFARGSCCTVHKKCRGYRLRNLRGQDTDEPEQGAEEGAERSRDLSSWRSWLKGKQKEVDGGGNDFKGARNRLSAWQDQVNRVPSAERQCRRQKTKLKFQLAALQWDSTLDDSCKLFLDEVSTNLDDSTSCVCMQGCEDTV